MTDVKKNQTNSIGNRGGRRAGAGRPKGVANKKTMELQKKVAEDGITPLDFMLQVMRSKSEDPARRLDAAKSAAQYVHPKLAAQSLTVDTIVSIETELKDILSRD